MDVGARLDDCPLIPTYGSRSILLLLLLLLVVVVIVVVVVVTVVSL